MPEKCKDRFHVKMNIQSGIIHPDRVDLSRWKLRAGGWEQPSVGTSATRHDLNLGARATGLTGTSNGEGLADGAERSAGSMHHEGSMHESRPEQQQRSFSEQSGSMGRVQGLYMLVIGGNEARPQYLQE